MSVDNIKNYSRGYAISIIVIAIILGVVIHENKKGNNYRLSLENGYQNSYREIEAAVGEIDMSFEKLSVLNNLNDKITTFVDIYKTASTAKENLEVLPYDHSVIDNVSKYLTQVSDFSYNMISKGTRGYTLTNEDNMMIQSFSDYGKRLYNGLNNITNDIEDGNNIEWEKVSTEEYNSSNTNNSNSTNKKSEDEKVNVNATLNPEETRNYGFINQMEINSTNSEDEENNQIYGSMVSIRDDFDDYPEVTYDGAFSDHILKIPAEFLKDKEVVSQEKARDIARNIIDDKNIESITLSYEIEEDENNTIPSYRFEVTSIDEDEPNTMIDISKQGGVPLWMLNYTPSKVKVLTNKVSLDEAENTARKFVTDKLNFANMDISYYEVSDRSVNYNFNYVENDTIIYSDLVNVKVSLENGNVIGFETLGYVTNHRERNTIAPKISESEAKGVCSQNFNVTRIRKALIPQSSRNEVLCYEILGKINDKEYLVYVNAETKAVENVTRLIRDESGVFTR